MKLLFSRRYGQKNQSTLVVKYECVLQNFSQKKTFIFGCEFEEMLLRILLENNKFDVMIFVANGTYFITKKIGVHWLNMNVY